MSGIPRLHRAEAVPDWCRAHNQHSTCLEHQCRGLHVDKFFASLSFLVDASLCCNCSARTDDPCPIVSISMNHNQQPISLRVTESQVSPLVIRMIRVRESKCPWIAEHRGGLLEGDPVLTIIGRGFPNRIAGSMAMRFRRSIVRH